MGQKRLKGNHQGIVSPFNLRSAPVVAGCIDSIRATNWSAQTSAVWRLDVLFATYFSDRFVKVVPGCTATIHASLRQRNASMAAHLTPIFKAALDIRYPYHPPLRLSSMLPTCADKNTATGRSALRRPRSHAAKHSIGPLALTAKSIASFDDCSARRLFSGPPNGPSKYPVAHTQRSMLSRRPSTNSLRICGSSG